jgi:hypothetical protein
LSFPTAKAANEEERKPGEVKRHRRQFCRLAVARVIGLIDRLD